MEKGKKGEKEGCRKRERKIKSKTEQKLQVRKMADGHLLPPPISEVLKVIISMTPLGFSQNWWENAVLNSGKQTVGLRGSKSHGLQCGVKFTQLPGKGECSRIQVNGTFPWI